MPDQPTSRGPGGAQALVGRSREIAAIDSLLASSLSSSRTLVLLGEAGIGKTALLAVAGSRGTAAGRRVISATGIEVEQELAFAGLHQLLRPILPAIDRLPQPQAAALRCAFGLDDSATPDRFLIGLATLTLLAEAADQQPVLLMVDDPRWLDRSSTEALAFAVRRLGVERVAVLVASRDEESVLPFGMDAERLGLGPLDDDAARQLLARRGTTIDDRHRARILAEAGGNPLALIELSSPSVAAMPIDEVSPPGTIRPTARLWHAFAGQLADLPPPVRRFLTLAAAADGSEVRPETTSSGPRGLLRACRRLHHGPDPGPSLRSARAAAATSGLPRQPVIRAPVQRRPGSFSAG